MNRSRGARSLCALVACAPANAATIVIGRRSGGQANDTTPFTAGGAATTRRTPERLQRAARIWGRLLANSVTITVMAISMR
jgi:hypothetical protein